jgi:hypothetical protein
MGKTYQLLKQIEAERQNKAPLPERAVDVKPGSPKNSYFKMNFTIAAIAIVAIALLIVLNLGLLYAVKNSKSASTAAAAKLSAMEKAMAILMKNDKTLESAIKDANSRIKSVETKSGKLEGQVVVQATAIRNFDKVKDKVSNIEQDIAGLKNNR